MSHRFKERGILNNKICILTTAHSVFDARIFHKQAKSLANAGYDITLIAQHIKNEVVDGVNIIALPNFFNRIRRFTYIPKVCEYALMQRAVIYHFHDPELIPVGYFIKSFLPSTKVVFDMHEDFPELMLTKPWLPPILRPPMRNVMHIIQRTACITFDAVITPTIPLSRKIRPAKKLVTIPNYPNVEMFTCIKQAKRYDVIHLGTISPFRLNFMFEVATNLVAMGYRVKWLFVGIADSSIEWAQQNLNPKIIDLFHFIGRVPHAEVSRYLNQAKIGINYHPYEERFLVAIPMKLFEYMLCGLPCISSALPLVRDIILDGKTGYLVYSNKSSDFAKCIVYLLENSQLADSIGRNGRDLALEKYTWQKAELELLKLYRDLLKES
jgi:glycosyltransferase involved in cell wall biosynthesis